MDKISGMANWLSGVRLGAGPLMVWLAALGSGRAAAAVLVLAGITDYLDGLIARRTKPASLVGAQLDAIADMVLLICATTSLVVLHPEIWAESGWLVAAVTAVITAMVATHLTSGPIANPGQWSAKVAGAILYTVALLTLWTSAYEPFLLRLAAAVLVISALDSLRAATAVIHASGNASRERSHNPQASNGVASKASPETNSASSAVPTMNEIRP